jgi:hypothetical protein
MIAAKLPCRSNHCGGRDYPSGGVGTANRCSLSSGRRVRVSRGTTMLTEPKIDQGGLYLDEETRPTLLVKVLSRFHFGDRVEAEIISGTDGWMDGRTYIARICHLRKPSALELLAWSAK